MKDNIDNYILLSTYYYCEETEMTSNYKCTFSLEGDESTGVTQKQMPNQREQYGGTVHLFIGTGHNPYKITFMPFTFDNNSIVIHRGLNSLFIFKSVSFSATTPKMWAGKLRRGSRKCNRLKDEKAIQTSVDYCRIITKCKGHECNFVWAVSRAYK